MLKILGDFTFQISTSAASASFPIYMGIKRQQIDDTGAVQGSLSPNNTTGIEFDWIWQKMVFCGATSASTNFLAPSYGGTSAFGYNAAYWTPQPMINTQAKRRVETGDAIVLYVDATNTNAQISSISLFATLRILCRHG